MEYIEEQMSDELKEQNILSSDKWYEKSWKLRETLGKTCKDCEDKYVFGNSNSKLLIWSQCKRKRKGICKSMFSYLVFLLAIASWQETPGETAEF